MSIPLALGIDLLRSLGEGLHVPRKGCALTLGAIKVC